MSNEHREKPVHSPKARVSEDMRNLVVERIRVMPSDLRVVIGMKSYTKEDLIENVKAGSKIGKTIMRVEMEYVRALASGKIFKKGRLIK